LCWRLKNGPAQQEGDMVSLMATAIRVPLSSWTLSPMLSWNRFLSDDHNFGGRRSGKNRAR